ncbi:tail assembly chaperone [Lysinibacillus piscis]|uniref:Uncharacterized protein n=1 Tax=Lysinibacillus piscis TaxID=2518931 RepID=A0ABQ5NMJ5_9BACI|nr:tail assembly chaperone [Lysinibacillus sp. KH24]GLC89331.1 hypothetical protein LYSBPC_24580 [Lysinibacillus sp. KH24]
MATLTIKDTTYNLKCSIMLDKVLNKVIPEAESQDGKSQKDKVSGGISKLLPLLIEQDFEGLLYLWESAIKLDTKKLPTQDEILTAIDQRMDEEGDATALFAEVFEAIDESAFSRNEFAKFKKNMLLVSKMKQKDEEEIQKMELMLKRLGDGYKEITGQELFEVTTTA